MQKNPTRRESEILKQFLYIREEKRNSLFIGLVLRGETEITKIIFQFRGGKRNLNCFQNDNKTRLVKTFPFCNLCLTQCQDEVRNQSCKSRGERDMKFSFSRVREKNPNHFSSRLSRDRDSWQCLGRSLILWALRHRVSHLPGVLLLLLLYVLRSYLL